MFLSPGTEAIRTKWVYDSKLDGKGTTTKYKARLVAKEYSQIEGVDFYEVFAPVIRYATVRTVMTITVKKWIM